MTDIMKLADDIAVAVSEIPQWPTSSQHKLAVPNIAKARAALQAAVDAKDAEIAGLRLDLMRLDGQLAVEHQYNKNQHGVMMMAAEKVKELAAENARLREALKFYAEKDHFVLGDADAWDTVSDEPQNYWCDEAGTATIEDGHFARQALGEQA